MSDKDNSRPVVVPPARKRTPEQQAYYELVTERTRRLQEHGVPAPASGTFGSPSKSKGAK